MILEHYNNFMKQNSFLWFIQNEKNKDYFLRLYTFLSIEGKKYNIWPTEKDRFKALEFFKPSETKVIILGQDPYHQARQADGLAFSTKLNKCPRSLANIIKEINKEYPQALIETYSLEHWAKQGVLLLNTILSVRENEANSHTNQGWEIFIMNLLKFVLEWNSNVIFALWGLQAQNFIKPLIKEGLIDPNNVLCTSHPSPLSYARGNNSFKNSQIFTKINNKLNKSIDFSLRKD